MRSAVRFSMRVVGAATLLVGLLAMSTGTAFAVKPDKQYGEQPPLEYAAGEVCDFALRIDSPRQKAHSITFFDREGNAVRTLTGGQLVTRVTNLETGESLTANIAGPGRFTYSDDETLTIAGGGPWLIWAFATDVSGAGMWLTKGPVRLEIDGVGNIVELDLPRVTTDVCEALGS